MKQFDYAHTAEALLTPRTVNLLTAIHEAKGRQSVQAAIHPETLESMTAIARIQSTSASNRIEGISTSDQRLNALVTAKTTPRNRDEEEIAGYRDVLSTIHENHDYIPLTPNVILQLHRDLFRHTPLTFGGHFKDTNNLIVERDAAGNSSVRFTPPNALITPELVGQACASYAAAIQDGRTDPLLAIALFVFDFTCIHPFNDGNGRMSRLLTLLLMYRAGYSVGKYISIERLIESSKETYYEALAASTQGWTANANDYAPFVNYLLGVILRAYKEFDERFGILGSISSDSSTPSTIQSKPTKRAKPTKEQRIAALFDQTLSPLSKAEVLERLPDISETTVERALRALVSSGAIIKIGAGRSTRYIRQR